MNKLILILIGLTVISCTDKPVSEQYYKAHVDEAREQDKKCGVDKNANATSCNNALLVIQAENQRIYQEKLLNEVRNMMHNAKDTFHK